MFKAISFVSLVIAAIGTFEDSTGGAHHMSAGWLAFWICLMVWTFLFHGLTRAMEDGSLVYNNKKRSR